MSQLPGPFRAAVGLVATALDNARTLPAKAVEMPVIAVSTALQISLRAQQRYAELALRGDELLARLHEAPDGAPSWATFDETPAQPVRAGNGTLREEQAEILAEAAARAKRTPATTTKKARTVPAKKAAATNGTAPASRAGAAADVLADTSLRAPARSTQKRPRAVTPAKPVTAPRNARPSAFDTAPEE